jgi:hypothetical protein
MVLPCAAWKAARAGRAARSIKLPQRFKRRAEFCSEKLRLLPRGEVSAFRESVVVNQFGIGFCCPAPRGGVDLIGKDAHGSRNRDTFRREKGKLAFPIETAVFVNQ